MAAGSHTKGVSLRRIYLWTLEDFREVRSLLLAQVNWGRTDLGA